MVDGVFIFMRNYTLIFLVGLALGGAVTLGLVSASRSAPAPANESAKVLDGLISDWTRPVDLSLASIFASPGKVPDTVRSLAFHLEKTYLIPKGVTIAQWILESAWGASDLRAMNYFGHTFAAVRQYMPNPTFVIARERVWHLGRIQLGDTIRFARYSSMTECFEVHGLYVSRSPRFRNAFAQGTPEAFARELALKYATDPDYGLKLVILMRRYQ